MKIELWIESYRFVWFSKLFDARSLLGVLLKINLILNQIRDINMFISEFPTTINSVVVSNYVPFSLYLGIVIILS